MDYDIEMVIRENASEREIKKVAENLDFLSSIKFFKNKNLIFGNLSFTLNKVWNLKVLYLLLLTIENYT